jgi:single-strand DNA-binding protein
MARDLNKVMLIGRVGKDPEIRYAASGKAVANFSLATSESWKDGNGDKQERTEWSRLVLWGRLAEVCGEYVHKGDKIFVEGKIQTREWEDKDGNKRSTTEIVCYDMIMLSSKSGHEAAEKRAGQGSSQSSGQRQQAPAPGDFEDIPF